MPMRFGRAYPVKRISRSRTALPVYDNSVVTPYQSVWNGGVPFNWAHNVGASSCGIVIACIDQVNSSMNEGAASAVSFGGVTCATLGHVVIGGGGGEMLIFGCNGVPAGPQTVSVTLTEGALFFSGYMVSFTYARGAIAGILQTSDNFGATDSDLLVPSQSGHLVWTGLLTAFNIAGGQSFTARAAQASGPDICFLGGDAPSRSSSVDLSAVVNGVGYAMAGLDLVGTNLL